jgi:cysteine desulfurase
VARTTGDLMSPVERAYFDWNATAPLRAEAKDAMLAALGRPGNASSVHGEGRAARALIERARDEVAALVGAQARQGGATVIFTSGATEANMLALTPSLEADGIRASRSALFVSAIEHPSVRAGGRFPAVTELPVTPGGVLDLAAADVMLARSEQPLVSLMLANNETGVVQPVRELAAIVHRAAGLLHVDAAQAPGRIAVDMTALGADLLTISGHKMGGPQGTGALVVRDGVRIGAPLLTGGAQERNQRAGTENVAAIAGFGAAAAGARDFANDARHMLALRNRIEAGIRAATPHAVIIGAGRERLPNTILVAVPGMSAETAIIAFDLDGIALSSGAACSSGKVQPSHVLAAMGCETLSKNALRISFGRETTENEVESLLNAWRKLVPSLSKQRCDTANQAANAGEIAASAA